jgi:hypothetical protein
LKLLPADVELVLGIDVPRIATTPLGVKLRSAFTGEQVPAACQALSAAQFGNLVLGALHEGGAVATLDGKLPEAKLKPCLDEAAKAHGGKVETKTVAGRKTLHIAGSDKDNGWLTWQRAGAGAILASSEAALASALDPKTAKLGGDLAAIVGQADQARMIWLAAMVPPDMIAKAGLPAGTINGPVSVRAGIDVAGDTQIDVVLGFASADEAAAVANATRALVGKLRQSDIGPLLAGLQLGVFGNTLHLVGKLDAQLTNSVIDAIKVK